MLKVLTPPEELGIYKRKKVRSQNLFFFHGRWRGRDLVFLLFFLVESVFFFFFSSNLSFINFHLGTSFVGPLKEVPLF